MMTRSSVGSCHFCLHFKHNGVARWLGRRFRLHSLTCHLVFPVVPLRVVATTGVKRDICKCCLLCLFFLNLNSLFVVLPPSIHRPAGPSQSSSKPWANGAGKSQPSELSLGPSPSPQPPVPNISVTPPAPKGNSSVLNMIWVTIKKHT